MEAALKGHPYVKTGIDMACWDILGQATAGQPVCTLLGGRYGDDFVLYRAISQAVARSNGGECRRLSRRRLSTLSAQKSAPDPQQMDIERIRQVAALLEPSDKLIADANTGWLMHEAARVVRGVDDIDVYIEQPCLTYEECLSIRRRTTHPFVLGRKRVDGIDMLLRGHADQAMDVVNIKISKFGGLTQCGAWRAISVCRWAWR